MQEIITHGFFTFPFSLFSFPFSLFPFLFSLVMNVKQ